MKFTEQERKFIRANRDILVQIFEKRIEELEKMAGNLDVNLTAKEFKIKYLGYKNFINELKAWLRTIKIIAKRKPKDLGV